MKLELIEETERLTPAHYLAVREDGLTFAMCLREAAGCFELVAQVDRLYGTQILQRKSPINAMIDAAVCKDDEDMQTFLRFVWNCIFARCQEIKSTQKASRNYRSHLRSASQPNNHP